MFEDGPVICLTDPQHNTNLAVWYLHTLEGFRKKKQNTALVITLEKNSVYVFRPFSFVDWEVRLHSLHIWSQPFVFQIKTLYSPKLFATFAQPELLYTDVYFKGFKTNITFTPPCILSVSNV